MEKDIILERLNSIESKVEENNIMLREIIKYINHLNSNANQENMDDFMRNIMANMISNGIEFGRR